MTSHNNIRKQKVVNQLNTPNFEEIHKWYQYITTCVLFNSWDSTAEALNGCDFDGDLCFTTNNAVLLKNTKKLPPIFCIQRKGTKKVPTEKDFIESNKLSFGDAIGATTNIITSQICMLAHFDPESKEYKELSYRVLCGQLYQQNEIDKAKGIISKPMPKYWKSLSCIKDSEDDTEEIKDKKDFLRRIAADKKPYFFIYNYDHLYSRYNKYIQQVRSSCYREFGIEFEKLYESYLNNESITEDQQLFIEYYKKYLPIDMSPCTVNRLCWNIENNITIGKAPETDQIFNYHLLKSKHGYSKEEYNEVRTFLAKEYENYKLGMKDLLARMREERIHGTDKANLIVEYNKVFITRMKLISSNEALCCDVLLDLAYKNNGSKKFVWEMCGQQIIKNLLERHGYEISYPVPISNEESEEFYYKGVGYRMDTVVAEIQQVEEE